MTLPGHVGVTFKASPGITPTIVEQSLDEPANLELTGVYNADSFTQTEVLVGKWNFASIEVFSCCWDNVNLGELVHFRGNLGEFKDYQTYFTCEGRGLLSRLSQDIDKVTQRLCRVKEFRDAECGHTAATVTIGADTYQITQTGRSFDGAFAASDTFINILTFDWVGTKPPVNYFANGKITIVGGPNDGVSREIAYSSVEQVGTYVQIQLKRPFPFGMNTPPSTATLTAGCNRTIEDCMKFSNIVNRRAEDYVPGLEAITRLPPSN
jgi:uncharacterized phage protein (TIGR02218 family)